MSVSIGRSVSPDTSVSRSGVSSSGTSSAAVAPSLQLDFINRAFRVAGAGRGFSDAITFTRATTGTRYNSAGLVESIAIDQPRFDYDPVTLAPKGLLIEEARTNLLNRSEEFDNAFWTKSRASITPNEAVAPDGTLVADKLVEDTTASNTHNLILPSIAGSNITYTASIFVKAAERSRGELFISDNVSGTASVGFDLSEKTVSAAGSSVWTGVSVRLEELPAGWFRVSVTGTRNNTGATVGLVIRTRDASGNGVYTGDGTSGIYIWGAQLEAGTFPTSYIPTTTAAVTRAADVALMTGTNFSDWYNQSEGTFIVSSEIPNEPSPSANTSMSVTAGSINERILLGQYFTATRIMSLAVAGVDQAVLQVAAVAVKTPHKFCGAYKLNDFAAASDGFTAVTDTLGAVPVVDRLSIGALSMTQRLNGHIRSIQYFTTRLANERLQELSR